mmetsp:Transcript_4858/g.13789  ORF Transcript_4858/g.13789 Transcript_4858/m.13789 type:complete len:209 (-) Transcript_4858:984-1610(-)
MKLGDFIPDGTAAGSDSQSSTGTKHHLSSQCTPAPQWTVKGTKKGGLPVGVETRRNGKVVVISNVEGDINVLLADVKRALGTGGVARPDGGYIEIQGGHHEKTVCNFLLRSGHLVGVNKGTISAASKSNSSKACSRVKSDGKSQLNAKASPPPAKSPVNLADTAKIPDVKKIKAMKPPELKAHLAARGASTQGNKKELVARLLSLKSS